MHRKWLRALAPVAGLALVASVACSHRDSDDADLPLPIALVKKIVKKDTSQRTVAFRGVISYIDVVSEVFVVQDPTGGIRVLPDVSLDTSMVRHQVEVRGQISPDSDSAPIIDAQVKDLGPATLPPARSLPSDVAAIESLDGQIVDLVAVVKNFEPHTDPLGRLHLNLNVIQPESKGRLTSCRLTVVSGSLELEKPFFDAETELNAVLSVNTDVNGRMVGFSLLAPDFSTFHVRKKAPVPSSIGLTTSAALKASTNSPHLVRLIGTLTRTEQPTVWRLVDRSGSIAANLRDKFKIDETALPAQAIQVVGFVAYEEGKLHLNPAEVLPAILSETAAEHQESTVLTSVREIRALTPNQAVRRHKVRLDGVVTYWDKPRGICFFQDKSDGIYVAIGGLQDGHAARFRDHVILDGVTGAGEFAPIVQQPRFTVLNAAAPAPQPSKLSAEDVFLGRADSQWVELTGIVQSRHVEGNNAVANVASGPHIFQIRLPGGAGMFPPSLEDRFVHVRGAAGTLFTSQRQLTGIQLFVPLPELVQPVDRSTPDSDALPPSPIVKLLQFDPSSEPGHRVHVRGVVTYSRLHGPTWVQDDSGGVRILFHNAIELSPGDVADVAAFAIPGTFSPVLHDAVIRKVSSGLSLHPIPMTAEDVLAGLKDSQLIQIDGRLVNQYISEKERVLLMRAGNASFNVRIPATSASVPNGSVWRATGVVVLRGKRVNGGIAPDGFNVIVDSSKNLVLLKAAPWATQERLWKVFGVASSCVGLVLGWVFVLRRRVRMQTSVISQKLVEVECLKEAAETASRIKGEFLANMSHEIRTPMNGILGMTELTLDTDLSQAQRENLVTVKASAESLLTILNDILDFSKIEAGKLELDPIEFNIRDNIEESLRLLAFPAHEKGLELVCNFNEDLPQSVIGDPTRLRQITTNLVSNAIKFTKDGEVTVEVMVESKDAEKATLHFIVSDTGIGIAADKQQAIFNAFVQADTSTTRKFGGTGLGLAISMRFVQLMQGRLWVESTLGQGSHFHFTATFGLTNETAKAEPATCDLSLSGISVLIADANSTNRCMLARTVAGWGMVPSLASHADEAFELLCSAARTGLPFALLLLDEYMVTSDGFALAEHIVSEPLLENLKKILFTHGGLRGDAARCRQLNIGGYLTKPVRRAELRSAISAVLSANPETTPVSTVTRHTLRQKTASSGGRVLVAEDNLVNQKIIRGLVERRGYSTRIVANGREALEAIDQEDFDLILMDVQMPVMDGFEATANIRKLEQATGKHRLIVAMTAHAMSGDRERCLRAGMDDYLTKPVDVKQLNALLERTCLKGGDRHQPDAALAN